MGGWGRWVIHLMKPNTVFMTQNPSFKTSLDPKQLFFPHYDTLCENVVTSYRLKLMSSESRG